MATAGLDEEEKRGGEESRLEEILTTLHCNQNSIEEMKRREGGGALVDLVL